MNANQLSNKLEWLYKLDCDDGIIDQTLLNAATMLRQQQTEIEALKEENIGIKAVLDEYRTQIQAEYERK